MRRASPRRSAESGTVLIARAPLYWSYTHYTILCCQFIQSNGNPEDRKHDLEFLPPGNYATPLRTFAILVGGFDPATPPFLLSLKCAPVIRRDGDTRQWLRLSVLCFWSIDVHCPGQWESTRRYLSSLGTLYFRICDTKVSEVFHIGGSPILVINTIQENFRMGSAHVLFNFWPCLLCAGSQPIAVCHSTKPRPEPGKCQRQILCHESLLRY